MLGVSFFELLMVMILALIIIGPKELPDLAKNLIRIIVRIKKFAKQTSQESGLIEIKEEIEKDMMKLEEETSTIIDIYGNEHEVHAIDKLRSDKNKEELEEEINKYNKINAGKKANR